MTDIAIMLNESLNFDSHNNVYNKFSKNNDMIARTRSCRNYLSLHSSLNTKTFCDFFWNLVLIILLAYTWLLAICVLIFTCVCRNVLFPKYLEKLSNRNWKKDGMYVLKISLPAVDSLVSVTPNDLQLHSWSKYCQTTWSTLMFLW